MDTSFAKVVTDLNGRNHIMIDGEMISLYGPTERVNLIVEAIVRGLRMAQRSDCSDGGLRAGIGANTINKSAYANLGNQAKGHQIAEAGAY